MPRSVQTRACLAGVLAAATVAVGGTTVSEAAPSLSRVDADGFKTRAVNTMLARVSKPTNAGQPAPSSGTQKAAADKAPPGAIAEPTGDTTTGGAQGMLATSAAADCAALNLQVTPTDDRVWLHWDSTGASSYAVWRQRYEGSWTKVGTPTGTSFTDSTLNPHTHFTYRVVAGTLTCDLGDWISLSTDDGWGVPDAVYGGASKTGSTADDQLMAQDIWSYAMPSGLVGSDPAFSPDGRRIAATSLDAGQLWKITVTDPANPSRGALVAVTMPAGFVGAEASWSPDGSRIAYTRYAIDDQGTVSSPQIHLVNVSSGADQVLAGSQGLIQADWRSNTTLIAAGFNQGEGLYTIPAAGGTKSAMIAGTDNAGYPAVAPDGRVYFVTGDGTNFAVKAVLPQANDQVGEVRTSTTHWFERPRVSPDGTIFVVDVDMHDVDNPDDNTFSVIYGTFGPDGMPASAIGAPRDATLSGFSGYDVRQPKSKGSSDFLGDAQTDLLARDSSGNLYVYPQTATNVLGSRTRIGAGWNIFNYFGAVGDLNGDDRADILARDKNGNLWRYFGLGGGKLATAVRVGTGWGSYTIVTTGDFNGDRLADIVARSSTGDLWLYPGNGSGAWRPRVKIGAGWNSMNAIIGVGDFDYDNDADLVAREAATAKLWLYPGNGRGGFSPRRQVGGGWNIFNGLAGPEFVGPRTGLYARSGSGQMVWYEVLGDGRLSGDNSWLIGAGWNPYGFTA